jgi:hypothetical protein
MAAVLEVAILASYLIFRVVEQEDLRTSQVSDIAIFYQHLPNTRSTTQVLAHRAWLENA